MSDLKRIVAKRFKRFGINKKREILRLAYEISKRDETPSRNVLRPFFGKGHNYLFIKRHLLRRRFPYSFAAGEKIFPHLPKLEIDQKNELRINAGQRLKLAPRNIYIEEAVSDSYLVKRLKGVFPKAALGRIRSIKEYIRQRSGFGIRDYNKRNRDFFVVNEKYDFFKKCPCTKLAVPCGYHVFNLGFGCVFECTYCYLQEYTNCPGIVLPANIEDFFERFDNYKRPNMRIGTGEFTDSLAMDDVTQYSMPLIEFFGKNRDAVFEFKTKSANIASLLKTKHGGNIVISWSLSPKKIIEENEFYSAPLDERLNSAFECVRAGYKVGFHFDPIIYYKGWGKDYQRLVDRLFDRIQHKNIAWISLGTLRFNPALKTIIENRFPKNRILDEELLLGFDDKLRYPKKLRYLIYQNMFSWIRKRSKKVYVYLCMEDDNMSKGLKQHI